MAVGYDAATFRAEANAFVEWLASYFSNLERLPVRAQVAPGALRAQLPTAAPEQPEDASALIEDLERLIVPGLTHWQSPNFFAYFPANNSVPSIMGELVSAVFGVQGMLWVTSPACTELESHMLDWLIGACGLPAKFKSTGQGGGVLQDSASSALLCALLAAREHASDNRANEFGYEGKLTIYGSAHAHSSLDKGVMIAGFGRRALRKIATDATYALNPQALEAAIKADLTSGLTPALVCATVGTTSTLAFDPLPAIGDICARYGVWLHVDAALAGSAAVCPEYQPLLAGLELADSYCFNPHKWLLTNFDCSCLYLADRRRLINALSITPEYLRNDASDTGTVLDYRDWQIPLGRRFRALKLWFVLRRFGLAGLREHIRSHIALTQRFAAVLASEPDFEIVAPVALNLVCFRYRADNAFNQALMEALNASGALYLSHTVLEGQFVLRFCVGQPQTTAAHVDNASRLIATTARRLATA